jgi:hypothetical protein
MRRQGKDHDNSHRLFLLLFFLSGAVLLRCWPPMGELTDGCEKLLPCLFLLPALLGGSPSGLWLIPAGALFLGALAMRGMAAMDSLSAAVPLLLLTPLFFVSAVSGMRLSEECLSALTRGNSAGRKELFRKRSAIWGASFAAAAYIGFLR